MKKLYYRIIIGFFFFFFIGNLIVMLTMEPGDALCTEILLSRMGSLYGALAVQTLLSGIIGAAGMGGMSLYQETDLSLVWATVTHFILIEAVFLPAALFLGWISPDIKDISILSAIMLTAFIVIWLAMFFHYRREVMELNNMNPRIRK